MSELPMLVTALLLGLYVLLAGGYALAYAIWRLRLVTRFWITAMALYGLHAFAALGLVVWAPLEVGWKALILASSIGFFAIPPATWRYLRHTHETERFEDDPQRSSRPNRTLARL